jgi:DNA polymerase-1
MPNSDTHRTVMLVDGYGLIFRAYHAIDPSMATSTGEQTNAVFGFARMLLDVIDNTKPDYAIVALEGGRTFRHDSYDGYKAHRAEMPQDLRAQIGRVRELIEALNIPIEEREGYEADDVIGSLSLRCSKEPALQTLIVTGDSDLLQLVDENVDVVLPGRPRFQDLRHFNRQAVIDRYGFGPEFIPDYKALVGDTSDNIPGVPGIGEKTATALITKFGGVEEIIAHLHEVTPTRAKTALEGNIDQLRASKQLATIVRDLDIVHDLDHSAIHNFDRERVTELFRELEFRTLMAKIPRPSTAAAPAPLRQRETKRTILHDATELASLVHRIRATETYAIDVETTSTDPMTAELVGIAIAVNPSESYYIPVGHQGDVAIALDEVRLRLQPVFGDPAIRAIAHHGKYDLQVLFRHGIDIANLEFDTMLAAYVLNESSVGLKDLAFSRLGIQMTEITELIGTGKGQLTMNVVPADQAGQYACGDVEATFELEEYYRPKIAEQNQTRLLHEIEMPLVPVLLVMERTGIAIDVDYLADLSAEIQNRMKQLSLEIKQAVGRDVNVNSNKQLATLLFDELKLPSGRRTKTGFSVDADVLEVIRGEHPVVDLILEYKSLGKLASTYVDSLPLQVNASTGRIHTSYNQTVAATGRLSSVNPNLQNIPIRTEMGRRVRKAFIADRRADNRLFEDPILLSADYSQIELRLMAHMSGEPFLVDAFLAGSDIHRATAGLVYGVDLENVTPDMRRVAKTVNFGLLYGMQAYGLSRDTGLSRADSQRFIDQYWSRLPKVKQFFEATLKFGTANGYVETLNGRRRLIPDLQNANGMRRLAAERMAINMPVQGTAADIMKIAMIQLHNKLKATSLGARMLLQVHDELVLEVAREDVAEVAAIVKSTMEHAAELTVPLEVDVASGLNWEELEELTVG